MKLSWLEKKINMQFIVMWEGWEDVLYHQHEIMY